MNKKVFIAGVMFIMIFTLNIKCEKVCDLNEVLKLKQLIVKDEYMYLIEEFKIYIYSMKTKKLIGSFGKKGEGPGEFIYFSNMIVGKNKISIDSENKILFFSKKGEFINEFRKGFNCNKLFPIKNNYVGFSIDFGTKDINKVLLYNVYDNKFKIVRTIGNNEYIGKLLKKIRTKKKYDDYIPQVKKFFAVYKQKIFLGDPGKGIYFEVFDYNGKPLRIISGNYKKVKMTAKFKNDYINKLKSSNDWERVKAKKNIIFKQKLPCYRWFLINNEKMFLFTYKIENNQREYLITNMNGKIIKKSFIANVPKGLISINKGYIYYTLENEEDELWELHRQKIFNN